MKPILTILLFLILNASTLNGFRFPHESLIFLTALVGIVTMPILTCLQLYSIARSKNEKHFIKGYLMLSGAYLFTNSHLLFFQMDGHGQGLFMLIILSGLLVCLIVSIFTEFLLYSKWRAQTPTP